MREIRAWDVTATVERLCERAHLVLGDDMLRACARARGRERSPDGREALEMITAPTCARTA